MTSRRLVSFLGTLLTVAGAVLLVYVGITWYQSRQQAAASPAVSGWSNAQKQTGREIAARLTGNVHRVLAPSVHRPVPGSEPATRLVIPQIGVNAPVVDTAPISGIWQVADWAVGHLSTTPEPGGVGNNALSAHDDIKGEIFKRLGELKPGDAIELYTQHVLYTYVVTSQTAVDPSDTGVLAPTPKPTVTLISCTPYWVDTERVIVQGVLKSRRAA